MVYLKLDGSGLCNRMTWLHLLEECCGTWKWRQFFDWSVFYNEGFNEIALNSTYSPLNLETHHNPSFWTQNSPKLSQLLRNTFNLSMLFKNSPGSLSFIWFSPKIHHILKNSSRYPSKHIMFIPKSLKVTSCVEFLSETISSMVSMPFTVCVIVYWSFG